MRKIIKFLFKHKILRRKLGWVNFISERKVRGYIDNETFLTQRFIKRTYFLFFYFDKVIFEENPPYWVYIQNAIFGSTDFKSGGKKQYFNYKNLNR